MAEYIDFNKPIDSVLHQLLKSNDTVNKDNSNMLFDYYKFLHLFRHNLLHYLVLKMFRKQWEEEKMLSAYFDFLPDEYSRKTPDIVLSIENNWYLIDVSISIDLYKTEKMKKDKYQPICDYINKNSTFNCFFYTC